MANVIRLDKVKGYPVSFENSIENLEQGLFLGTYLILPVLFSILI